MEKKEHREAQTVTSSGQQEDGRLNMIKKKTKKLGDSFALKTAFSDFFFFALN